MMEQRGEAATNRRIYAEAQRRAALSSAAYNMETDEVSQPSSSGFARCAPIFMFLSKVLKSTDFVIARETHFCRYNGMQQPSPADSSNSNIGGSPLTQRTF